MSDKEPDFYELELIMHDEKRIKFSGVKNAYVAENLFHIFFRDDLSVYFNMTFVIYYRVMPVYLDVRDG